jgi:exodeoxyribonuclease VII large subunit
MDKALSVTAFVRVIDDALGAFDSIEGEGEVSGFRVSHDKWFNFDLKDKESNVRCFMTVWDRRAEIEDGMMVRVSGRPTLTQKWGFSFNLKSVQPAGEGALRRAFVLLQKKLTTEGLFATDRKRSLPRFPQHVVLITSREAAAYSDFIKVLNARVGGLKISFIHTQVQGKAAPQQIVEALETANTALTNLDVIVLARGGGSLEDLQAFNDETVVRAVAASRIPTIVGVGHERDVTLAEMAADVRASTPSNAAELLVQSREKILLQVEGIRNNLLSAVNENMIKQKTAVKEAVDLLRRQVSDTHGEVQSRVASLLNMKQRLLQNVYDGRDRINSFRKVISYTMDNRSKVVQQKLVQLQRMLNSLSPQQTLQRGYSVTRGADGKILKSVGKVIAGEEIATQLADGVINSTIINKK